MCKHLFVSDWQHPRGFRRDVAAATAPGGPPVSLTEPRPWKNAWQKAERCQSMQVSRQTCNNGWKRQNGPVSRLSFARLTWSKKGPLLWAIRLITEVGLGSLLSLAVGEVTQDLDCREPRAGLLSLPIEKAVAVRERSAQVSRDADQERSHEKQAAKE